MAALTSTPTPIRYIQHQRFTSKQHGYQLYYLSLSFSGNIAVSGHHCNDRRTFMDLFSGRNPDSRDDLELFYSEEFENYSNYSLRCVLFLENDGSKVLTCIGDKVEIIDTKNRSKVLKSCRVNGKTRCLAVRGEEIFIGLRDSKTVIVLNSDLKETKKIILQVIKDGDWLNDFQVIKDTVFICTRWGRAFSVGMYDSIAREYTDSTGKWGHASSITVSETLGLVAVVWSQKQTKGIIVYFLNKNESLLVFDVDCDVSRIRISGGDRNMITGNEKTGKIMMYDMEQLFSFEAMKRTMAYVASPEEWKELRKYFGVAEEEFSRNKMGDDDKSKQLSEKEKTIMKMECLFIIIEEKGHLHPNNINILKDAVSSLGDDICTSNLKGALEGFTLHGTNVKSLRAETMTRQKAYKDERNQLSSKLETTEKKGTGHEKTLDDLQGEFVRVKKQYEEQETTFRKDMRNAERKIEALEGEKMALSDELEKSKLSLDLNKTRLTTLTEELAQARAEIKTLSEQLKLYEQKLDASTKNSKEIDKLTEQPKKTNQLPELMGTESTKKADGDVPPGKSKQEYSTLEKQQRHWFLFLMKNLTEDWRYLGRHLDLLEGEISRLKKEYKDDIKEGTYQMLLCWQQENGVGATREKLIEALKKLPRTDLAEKLMLM